MNTRHLLAVTTLLTLAATPFAAQAHGSDTAAEACVQAFVDTYLPKDQAVKLRVLPSSAGPLGNYSRRYTIDLSARLSSSGHEIVSARCVASPDGRVIEMASLPALREGVNVAAR